MIELTFLQELMSIKQVHQKIVIFATISIFNKGFKFQPNVCSKCHNLLILFMNLSDITILNIKDSYSRYIISRISKNEVINLMQIANLTEKIEAL